ncbi:MAG TPA: hypothetical protein VGM52_17410 [Herbaspirillum sp.]|jgi:hypothetical protein
MTIGQVGGAGPAPSPNIDTQLRAGAAEDTNGHMVASEHLSKRDRAIFNAASQWSKPGGTQTALQDMKQVKIAESSRQIEDWDEAIDSNPGELPLQNLTKILREIFKSAIDDNKCKKLLLVSSKGQIMMTRQNNGAEMYAHIEGEKNYKKEIHLSIGDKLTLSVLRALYSDNIVKKFLPLNGAVGRDPAADDMPDDTDAPHNNGSQSGSRRGSGPGFVPGNESKIKFDPVPDPDPDHGSANSDVLCVHVGGSNIDTLCIRMSDKRGADVTADHIQSDASDFDIETFNRDAGLTEERNVLHSNFGSVEQVIPKQIVSPAASELRVDTSSSVRPINDSDPVIDNLMYMEVKITPENVVTTMSTMDGGIDSKTTELPLPLPLPLSSPPSSPAPAVTPLDNGVDDERFRKNLADFDAIPKAHIDYKHGLVMTEDAVTRL